MQISDINGKVTLSNGIEMPYLGLGVYKTNDGKEVIHAIDVALTNGYRLIDTAAYYNNEDGVGKAVANSQIPRSEIFISTKVWNADHGYDNTLKAIDDSLEKLQMDYVDLYLIHWPVPDKYVETWRALETIYQSGKAKAIGLCNCVQHHLQSIQQMATVQPMVLQNEFHPHLTQTDLRDFCAKNKIQYQAWSPLMRGHLIHEPLLERIAQKYQKTVAQIVIRWDLQSNVLTIPKSVHKDRIIQNSNIFDFALTEEDMTLISSLNDETRTGAHPDHFMEHFAKK